MFYHFKCGRQLYADISSSLLCLVSFTITRDGVRPSHIEMLNKDNDKDLKFYCSYCREYVNIDDIRVYCMNCGEMHSIDSSSQRVFIPHRSGGIYCEKCCSKYFSEESRTEVQAAIIKIKF